MLPLTFENAADYDKVAPEDKLTLEVTKLAPGKQLPGTIHKKDGSKVPIKFNHTMNEGQIEWFKAGSALNRMKELAQ